MSSQYIASRMSRVRPSPTAAISDRVRAMVSQGMDVINLGEGELDFDTPRHIKQAGIDAITRGETKYTAVAGTASLKAAIAAKFERENGLSYQAEEIIAGSGAKQLIFNALLATVSAGDEVLIPAPYWVSYPDMVALADGEARIIPCREASGWKLQAAALAQAITPKTRWLLLNSPNNPSGALYSAQELQALAAVLAAHPQVLILADDIYEHICLDDAPFVTLAQVAPSLRDRILTVNGLSKGYSMTGWRLGYAGGPAWLIRTMEILQSQSTSNPCTLSQSAAAAALNQPMAFLAGWLAILRRRRQQVMTMIASTDGLDCALPPAAFYAFVNCQRLFGARAPDGALIMSDHDMADYLVRQALVATIPGSAFGAPGYLRLAYAVADDRLAAACQRIQQACRQLRHAGR